MSKRINRKAFDKTVTSTAAETKSVLTSADTGVTPGRAYRRFVLKSVIIGNKHASTDVTVDIKCDGVTKVGNIICKASQPPTGVSLGEDGIKGTAGGAWTAVTSAAGDLSITVIGHIED